MGYRKTLSPLFLLLIKNALTLHYPKKVYVAVKPLIIKENTNIPFNFMLVEHTPLALLRPIHS